MCVPVCRLKVMATPRRCRLKYTTGCGQAVAGAGLEAAAGLCGRCPSGSFAQRQGVERPTFAAVLAFKVCTDHFMFTG